MVNILATPRTLLELRGRLGPGDLEALRAEKLTVRKFLEVWGDAFELRNGRWATREGGGSSSVRQSTLGPRPAFRLPRPRRTEVPIASP